MSGKGISDAVRGSVGSWITSALVTTLYDEYRQTGGKLSETQFAARVRSADSWKRGNRTRDPNGPGWLRHYYSLEFGGKGSTDVNLRVRTDSDADMRISYVTFHVRGKLVSGGACNVPSVLLAQYNNAYKALTLKTTTVTTTTAATEVVKFVPFTEKQLAKLATQYEFGGMGAIDRMFEDRV